MVRFFEKWLAENKISGRLLSIGAGSFCIEVPNNTSDSVSHNVYTENDGQCAGQLFFGGERAMRVCSPFL